MIAALRQTRAISALIIALLWAAGSTGAIACECIGDTDSAAQVFHNSDGGLQGQDRPDCPDHPAHSQCQSCHAHMVAARASIVVASQAVSPLRSGVADNAPVIDTVFNLFRPPRA